MNDTDHSQVHLVLFIVSEYIIYFVCQFPINFFISFFLLSFNLLILFVYYSIPLVSIKELLYR